MRNMPNRRRQAQAGLTYVESLLGVLLLSVCLAPALQAIGNNISRHTSLLNNERNLGCLLRIKEQILAQPFNSLLNAAVSSHSSGIFSVPSSYSEAPTATCPLQNVYILHYDVTRADPFIKTTLDMVYVRIEQAGGLSIASLAMKQ